jgi:hypothetical protein
MGLFAVPQLFSRSADVILRTSLVGGVLLGGIIVWAMLAFARSPYMTNQDVTIEQPVPFSHQHHVADIGIDCRYCHQTVETSARAGVPSTQVCMNCHRQLWNQTEILAPVRNSFRNGKPLQWNRVHDLPDYVYFNHSIHIHKGIGCYSCHGDVSEMALTRRAQPLTMQWCLECHRDPQQHVRPREFVFETKPLERLLADRAAAAKLLGKKPDGTEKRAEIATTSSKSELKSPTNLTSLRQQLANDYHLKSRTDCFTCHR